MWGYCGGQLGLPMLALLMYVENVVEVDILTNVLGTYSRGVWTISFLSLPVCPVELSPSCPTGLCPCVYLISARRVGLSVILYFTTKDCL